MKRFIQLSLIATITIFCLSACSSKKTRCENWSASEEFEQEIGDLNEALVMYSQNPTKENCEAYKDAYLDYLDALKDWEDCYIYIGQQQAFNNSIEQAEEAINNLNCD